MSTPINIEQAFDSQSSLERFMSHPDVRMANSGDAYWKGINFLQKTSKKWQQNTSIRVVKGLPGAFFINLEFGGLEHKGKTGLILLPDLDKDAIYKLAKENNLFTYAASKTGKPFKRFKSAEDIMKKDPASMFLLHEFAHSRDKHDLADPGNVAAAGEKEMSSKMDRWMEDTYGISEAMHPDERDASMAKAGFDLSKLKNEETEMDELKR